MNAPFPPAAIDADCAGSNMAPADIWTVRPQAIRMSSRPLGWRPLNIERREENPGSHCLPCGTTEHLIIVSLSEGHYVRQGLGDFADNTLEAGHVSIHPAFRPVRWEWDTRLSVSALALEPEFLLDVAEETFGLNPSQVELKIVEAQRDVVITNIAGQMSREALRGDASSRRLSRSLAEQLAIHLLRNYLPRRDEPSHEADAALPRSVTAATDFINRYYGRDISLSEIANAAYVSPYHLVRVFKKATGMTPHQYLINVRVNSARSLLAAGAGARSLAEIAYAVGFADQSHLTRHFKRVFGVTPRQLRQ